jgi:hypothetical protein
VGTEYRYVSIPLSQSEDKNEKSLSFAAKT